MTREELEMRTLVRESDVIDRTDGSELAKAFNYLWEKYVEQEPCEDVISRHKAAIIQALKDNFIDPEDAGLTIKGEYWLAREVLAIIEGTESKTGHWIPVSERLPELNKPLLVTAYHRVCYAHMISESGNYGYPVFRLHEIKDSDRGWVQETISHEPYSKGRIDAWMYIDIPEPYKVEPQERSDKE